MKVLPIFCLLFTLISAKPQNVPKEIRNVLSMLSMFDIKPDKYIQFTTETNETKCHRDLVTLLTDARKKEEWALTMLDATAKIPDGIWEGNRIFYGDYDACLQIKTGKKFVPQYCAISFNLTQIELSELMKLFRFPMLLWGVCLPSTCTPKYIERILQNVYFPQWGKNLSDTFPAAVEEGDCARPDDEINLTELNWMAIYFIVTVTVCVVSSTVYEIIKPSKTLTLWTSFSVLSNGRDIFAPNDKTLKDSAMKGYRGVLAFGVLFGHFFLQMHNGNTKNPLYAFEMHQTAAMQSTLNIIDGFILLSGLGALLAFYGTVAKTKVYDPVMATIKRYLKLMVPAMVLYFLRVGIAEHLHRGPIYNSVHKYQTHHCWKSKWPLIFMYENFANSRAISMCFQQYWYLSLDMQLFIFTQLILVITKAKSRLLFNFTFILCIACDLLIFYLAYVHDLGWTASYTPGDGYFDYIFVYPQTRGVSWFAGMAWALLILKNQKTDFSKHRGKQLLLWIFSIATIYYTCYMLRFEVYGEYTQPNAAFYSAFHHITLAVLYGWVIFAIIYEISGLLGKVLSFGPFVFLGEISFEIFLLHLPVIDYFIAIARYNIVLSYYRFWYHSIALTGVTSLVSVIFALFISRPFNNLVTLATKNVKILPIAFKITESSRTESHAKKN